MNLGQLLSQGGWAMWPIYLCSVLALLVFAERWWFFRSIRARELSWLPRVLQATRQQNWSQAKQLCQDADHPVSEVLTVGIQTHQTRADRVAAEAERSGQSKLQEYERFLPVLGFITQVAPLLGLLGTVLGMVKMFYGLQIAGKANVDIAVLSQGIWQALLTTAAGLIVAAPSLGAHQYLTHRVDRLRHQLSDAVERLLTALPQHSPPETSHLSSKETVESGHSTPLGA